MAKEDIPSSSPPLVSVIIPCYNHGKYLSEAIQSVLNQSYQNTEVIVVDDGSVDNTPQVCLDFNQVHYIYQKNKGLSAARNTGTSYAKGEFLVYLDADDLLIKDGIKINLNYMIHNPNLAFVSGGHTKHFLESGKVIDEKFHLEKDHYLQLLQCNYIGMHAAVMYAKWTVQKFQFDPTLPACEDYDLYLRIARKHPVMHHTEPIAEYRFHQTNMSSNIPKMLLTVLKVLKSQKPYLANQIEKEALLKGEKIWISYYTNALNKQLIKGEKPLNFQELKLLVQYQPKHLIKYFKNKIKRLW